jgi:hypothetical protein
MCTKQINDFQKKLFMGMILKQATIMIRMPTSWNLLYNDVFSSLKKQTSTT